MRFSVYRETDVLDTATHEIAGFPDAALAELTVEHLNAGDWTRDNYLWS